MFDFRSQLRAFPSALRGFFVSRAVYVPLASALILGLALPTVLSYAYPRSSAPVPYALAAATYVIQFAAILLTLAWMGVDPFAWKHLCVWLASVLFLALSLGALALSTPQAQPAGTWFLMASIMAAQTALLCALHALLVIVLAQAPRAALQLTVLLTGVLMSGLLWSREPIHLLSRYPASRESRAGDRLTYGVMELSPPVALAAAWHEAGASSGGRLSEGSRFDLIRAPLTYEVWIGSYQAVPYPAIMPVTEVRAGGQKIWRPNLVLTLLFWALPTLLLGDVLLNAPPKRSRLATLP